MRTTPHQQPTVDQAYELLATRVFDDREIDLFGTLDETGYEVCDIALAGTDITLYGLVDDKLFVILTKWANDTLPSAAELRRESREQQRIDQAEWERAYA